MNKIILTGNLGHAASVRDVPRRDGSGTMAVVNFSLAVRLGWGERETTQWWDCAWWGERAAKVAQWLPKGQKVLVEGEAQLETYTKRDGSAGAKLVVVVRDLELIGGRTEGEAASSLGGQAQAAPAERVPGGRDPVPAAAAKKVDEDVPF